MTTLQILSRQALDRDPQARAIDFQDRSYSVGQVRGVAERVADLVEGSGAPARSAVVFIARNEPVAVAALLGLLLTGRTLRMIYPFQSPTAIAAGIARLGGAVVVASQADFTDPVRDALRGQGMAAISLAGMEATYLPGFEASGARPDETLPEAPHIEILTSGTTGPPKHFALPLDTIATSFVGTGARDNPGGAGEGAPASFFAAPIGNISGIYGLYAPLLNGVPIHLVERFTVKAWHDYVLKYRPKSFGAPAAVIPAILDADLPVEDLASIEEFNTGAAALDPTVHRAFERKYGIALLLSYGATELGGPVAAMTPALHRDWGEAKFGSVGKAYGGVKLRVVDPETGAELPPGEQGLLEVVSPRIGPDWIRTSDLAIIDADGFLFHRGRADGAIMRGGFKIVPETVERALCEHPAVSEAAVVPLADRRLGQVPVAALLARPGVDRPDDQVLEAHLRERVLATYIPVAWHWFEDLPRTPSMKIDRGAVARLLADKAEPAVSG